MSPAGFQLGAFPSQFSVSSLLSQQIRLPDSLRDNFHLLPTLRNDFHFPLFAQRRPSAIFLPRSLFNCNIYILIKASPFLKMSRRVRLTFGLNHFVPSLRMTRGQGRVGRFRRLSLFRRMWTWSRVRAWTSEIPVTRNLFIPPPPIDTRIGIPIPRTNRHCGDERVKGV